MSLRRASTRSLCHHCGFPVRRSPSRAAVADEKLFCCYGCSLAHQIARGDGHAGSGLAGGIFSRLMLAVFLSMAVMVFSIALYADVWFGIEPDGSHPLGPLAPLFGWIAWGFATPVLALLGWPLLCGSVTSVDRAVGPANVLIVVGVVAAYVLSVVNLLRGDGTVYFETAVMVLVLVTLGRFLDAKARYGVSRSVRDLLSIDPEHAVRVGSGEDGSDERVAVERVRRGDLLRVVSGERVPADGAVARGRGVVDESLLTGESEPRLVRERDFVRAWSYLGEGHIELEVRAPYGERLLDRMSELVDSARERRMPLERLSDRVVRWFLPVAGSVALATAAWWGLSAGWEDAILNALAVLLIACPCALGIATPLATWVAIGRLAREGILVRGGEVFERLARPCRVFFDKTGTLTDRRLEVASVKDIEGSALHLAASLARCSRHPVAEAIERCARDRGLDLPVAEGVEERTGLGVLGSVDGKRVVLGRRELLAREMGGAEAISGDPDAESVVVAADGELVGTIDLGESTRYEARAVVEELARRGCEPTVLTGDTSRRGEALARELGVSVRSRLLPTDKVSVVEAARRPGTTCVMVGDGLNDAPVLAAADVSVALGDGAELSRDVADVVVLENDERVLGKLIDLLDASRATVRRVRFNLFWAFAYNSAGMLLAACGVIHPLAAALLMIASSLFVVLGSTVGGGRTR